MEEELVSVIITTYKRSDKLENAIRSVLEQTYKNIEVIVVDDNLPESNERQKTENIIKKYNGKIKYIKNKKNLGAGPSRNEGIKVANGKYIAFLDDDDKYLPEKIEKQYTCYKNHIKENPGLIYCYTYREDNNNKVIGSYKNDYEGNPLYEEMLNCIAGTSLWFTSKEVMTSVGMFEKVPSHEDSLTLLKILVNGYNIFRVPECLVLYYEHGEEKLSSINKRNIEGFSNYREWCRKYYFRLNKHQKKNVEFKFSKELLTKYVFLNMKEEAKQELKNMIKLKPFNKKTILGILKYLFPKQYLNELERKQNGKSK